MNNILLCAIVVSLALPGTAIAQKAATTKETSKGKVTQPVKEIGVVETNLGTFEIELYREDAPKTVDNFVKLAEKKFFDGVRVHRVVPGFVIQTGDEKSRDLKKTGEWGTGGQSIYGKPFSDELNPATLSYKAGYKKGVAAMANAGPNTNTSQFFVMLEDNPRMPKNYTIFGKVTKGIETVEKIGKVEIIATRSPGDGRPKDDVVLKKVTIRKEPITPAAGK